MKLSDVTPLPVEWLVYRFIQLGGINVIVGLPGVGKSKFLAWVMAKVTRGELGPRRGVVYYTKGDEGHRRSRHRQPQRSDGLAGPG